MKALITISRFIVGVLFVFSGLIKANDPLGLSYKMQEFFEIWGWNSLNDFTLVFSILMIAFEIIAGVAVLVGWQMRLFSWLLLLLTIFFTFLTGYALFSGKIRECGCFGDCIPLTAQQSFIKDLILLLLILLIFANRNKIKNSLPAAGSFSILLLTTIFSFGFQWWVLKHLPVIDCLPYKLGRNIAEQMKVPAGAIQDSTVINFVYMKQGKEVEFTADKFPDDFDDSLYTFVKRYDKLIRKGNAEVAIKDFALSTKSGNDTTQAILNTPGYTVLAFTKGIKEAHPAWLDEFTIIHTDLSAKNIPIYFVTNDFDNISVWAEKAGINNRMTILKCDFVAIKTAARADPTIYLLQQGNIVKKWSYADFDKASDYLKNLKSSIALNQFKGISSSLIPHTSYLKPR
ncbi:MAG: BT_3928 family protein [Chitinophagaceae bacterium]